MRLTIRPELDDRPASRPHRPGAASLKRGRAECPLNPRITSPPCGVWRQRGQERRSIGALILLGLTIAAVAACSRERDVVLGPGIKAPGSPVQTVAPERVREHAGHRLRTRAGFSITAKLLSKRRYRWDEMAAVVPWDFALAWGAMSDEALLAGTRLAQGDRHMFWHLYDTPLPLALIERASANVHLIPASSTIEEQLGRIPTGAIVTLRGELVDLTLPDGRVIPTSVSRNDRGDGACEILFVSEIRLSAEVGEEGGDGTAANVKE